MKAANVITALVLIAWAPSNTARRHGAPSLKAEDNPRKSQRAAECQFGNQVKELGSTWFADLGPPFGVMYCIKCECVSVQKKRRVVGRIHCRNIKHECPKPSCEEPVLPPGRCCKVCPGDLNSPDIIQDVNPIMTAEEEEKNQKYFAALLTGRTSQATADNPMAPNETATGRFTFHRRNLYFSFYSSTRPKSIQFLDTKGNILEEQPLGGTNEYQNTTGKVCGVWRRIPREYRRLIRDERLVVSLMWEKELSLSGQLYRYRTLATEMYSALLEGGQPGSGGTAIVSIATTNPSIHITVIFNGVFTSTETSDVALSLKLFAHDKQAVVMDEIIRIAKPSWEMNVMEVQAAVSAGELRMLSRGRLTLTLTSRSMPSLFLSGKVQSRASCDLYQALLVPPPTSLPANAPAGLAWLYVDNEGGIRYHVQLEGVPEPYVVTLVVERRGVDLEDLTPWVRGGRGNGTVERVSPRHLEQLYNGDLGVSVAWKEGTAKGRLAQRPAVSPRASSSPALLTGGTLAALAWTSVDSECNLHYEVAMSGVGTEAGDFELWLGETPLDAPGAPVTRKMLEAFSGPAVEGSDLALIPADLSRLNSGLARLELVDASTSNLLLRSHWAKMPVPGTCLPQYSDNDVPAVGVYLRDNGDGGVVERGDSGPCYHGGRFHEDGTQWRGGSCNVCHCSGGRAICDPVICPPTPPGCHPAPCCHSCYNMTEDIQGRGRGCVMAGQFFLPGSSWHPYLPPNGFDICLICTCNALTLKVSCPRVDCPKLNCEEKSAIWPDKKSCCKVCPPPNRVQQPKLISKPSGSLALGDEGSALTEAEILAAGGCRYPVGGPYPNGHEWHPRLYSHGEIKCVKCRCKDGKVKCERKRCTKWSCSDECCLAQCARSRRHALSRRHWNY